MTKYLNLKNKILEITKTTKGYLVEIAEQKPNTISQITLMDEKTLDFCINEGFLRIIEN